MATKIIMPAGGQTTDEVVLQRWCKQIGDAVKQGDVLFEVETDKAVLEIESCASGMLLARYYEDGASVPAKATVAWVGNAGEGIPGESSSKATSSSAPAPAPSRGNEEYQSIMPDETLPALEPTGKILASPAARYFARRHGVSLHGLPQPVKKRAVAERLRQGHVEEDFEDQPLTSMRRTIAARMTESALRIPTFSAEIMIDMTRSCVFRDTLKAGGVKVSFNDLIMKSAAFAILDFPAINASWRHDAIRVYRAVNFGLAVSIAGGLVVPVARRVEQMTLPELAAANQSNIEAVKAGGDVRELMRDGTITLSNLGGFGIRRFTAIINPPEACILAAGAIDADGMMCLNATFDHRIIDGALGAGFLKRVKEVLEHPEWLLL